MGYDSTAHGEVAIMPPLAWAEIRGNPYLPFTAGSEGESWRPIVLALAVEDEDTDRGRLTVISAVGVEPAQIGEPCKRYGTLEALRELVDQFPDHAFTGAIELLGEDGRRWRYVARNGRVWTEKPRTVWEETNEDM